MMFSLQHRSVFFMFFILLKMTHCWIGRVILCGTLLQVV